MLNVNAKSFVPPGAESMPPVFTEGLFRYRIDASLQRMVDVSTNARTLNSLSSLLTSRFLFADRGTRDQETLSFFLMEAFRAATNSPVTAPTETPTSGFLLSKSIISLSADIAAVNVLNNAPGFVLHLDVPRELNADVSFTVSGAFETLYNRFNNDPRVSAFGYSRSVVGLNKSKSGGAYRHYFYIACAPLQEQANPLSEKIFSSFQIPHSRATLVSSVVPYMCGPRSPLAVVITVGDSAKNKAFTKELPADFAHDIEFFPHDCARTFANIKAFEVYFLSVLNDSQRWEKTKTVHLSIAVVDGEKKNDPLPIWDVIFSVGCLCDDTGACVSGISFSDTKNAPGSQRLLALNPSGAFFMNATFAEMSEKQTSFDTAQAILGNVPLHLCRGITHAAMDAATRVLTRYVPLAKKRLADAQQLTRANFADAADQFAKHRFFVRRRVVGAPILLGTDSNGIIFGIDLKTGSVFSVRKNVEGYTGLFRDSLFTATLCSTSRGRFDYRIVIDDVFLFQNHDVRNLSFVERWRHVESTDLKDEEKWPHVSMSRLVLLHAGFVPFEETESIVNTPSSDFPTSGIAFVDDTANALNGNDCSLFYWVYPSSITVRFSVGAVKKSPEENTELKRLFLHVAKNTDDVQELIPYEGEYVDVTTEFYPTLESGCIVECILRRAEDGAHWWDVVRDFPEGTNSIATFDHVDRLVHSPGITKQEMLWLLNCPSYQCERCHKVNDAGRYNTVKSVYWCKSCWTETGHGDCSYCGRTFVAGMVDSVSKLFYCGNCWTSFSTPNSQAEIGYHLPPPPNVGFTQQVTTRCVSLLIDYMNPKCPSDDVLDLCCGSSVIRKWMRNKTRRYVGIDLKASVVDLMNSAIMNSDGERPPDSRYETVCADVFSADFWTQTILKIHPRQFHLVSCFAGLHHVFSDEESARRFVARVANALVPGGVFIGFTIDAGVLYSKGLSFENSVFKAEWDEDAVPRIGHTFSITAENGPIREENVVPIDFLIAVATEYGLEVMSDACLTFRELIEKDANWTKVPSADEKEYLCILRTFAFKKEGTEQVPSEVKALV